MVESARQPPQQRHHLVLRRRPRGVLEMARNSRAEVYGILSGGRQFRRFGPRPGLHLPSWELTTRFTLLLAGALCLIQPEAGASAEPDRPTGLLVNGVNEPLAIDRDTARFTWRSRDTVRGARQTAYQILVSSNTQSLAAGRGEWWD